MANEPEPGRGQGGRGNAANVTAGFKIELRDLKKLNDVWVQLVSNVKEFNRQLGLAGRAFGPSGFGSKATGGGAFPMAQHGWPGVSVGTFSTKASGKSGGASAKSDDETQEKRTVPHAKFSKVAVAVGAPIGAATAYGVSHAQNQIDMERLAQTTSWLTPSNTPGFSGTPNQQNQAIRHAMAKLTGYSNTPDLMTGISTLQSAFGGGWGARQQILAQQAGQMANGLGSFAAGARARADMSSPSTYNSLLSLGIHTIGPNGAVVAPGVVAGQFLRMAYGGRMPTKQELAEGMSQGSNLQQDFVNYHIGPELQQSILNWGSANATIQEQTPGLDGQKLADKVLKQFTKTGGDKSIMGSTVFDAQRAKGQSSTQMEQDLADTALPALRVSIETTTKIIDGLNAALKFTPAGAITGTLGGPFGGVVNAAGGVTQGLINLMMIRSFLGKGGKTAATTAEEVAGTVGKTGLLAGASGLLGRIGKGNIAAVAGGLMADYAGGKLAAGHKSGWRAGLGSGLSGAGQGAALGALLGGALGFGALTVASAPIGAVAGGLIGGGLGFAKGLFGAGGGGIGANFGSVEEVDALAGVISGDTPGVNTLDGVGPSHGSNRNNPGGPTSAGALTLNAAPASAAVGGVTPRGSAAIAWMVNQSRHPSQNWHNKCLVDVRESLGVAAKYGTAASAWSHTRRRHTGTPPPGVPVWWTGGDGHVALSAGGGNVWTNDFVRDGQIDLAKISDITKVWGKPYMGWTDDVDDVVVYNSATAAAASTASGVPGLKKNSTGSSNATTGPVTVTGGSNPAQVANFFRTKGLSSAQIAGILGNLQQESGVNPKASGGGLVQWIGARWNALAAYANRTGGSTSSMATQLGYLWTEMNGAESGAYKKFLADSSTPTAAATSWSVYYERPGIPMLSNRIKYAKQFAAQGYKDGAWNIATDRLAMIHQGEMVVPSAPATAVRDYVRRQREVPTATNAAVGSGGTVRPAVNFTLNMPIQVAQGTTSADAQRLARTVVTALERDSRLASVMGGD